MISSKKHRYLNNYSDLKVGDKLTVLSRDWYISNYTVLGNGLKGVAPGDGYLVFSNYMTALLGQTMTVKELKGKHGGFYEAIYVEEDDRLFQPWVFEEFEFPPKRVKHIDTSTYIDA